jgi:3-oxoacyl-[acyl-carrier-protein] synthase II
MKIYIQSTGNISPQHSLDKDAFFLSRETTGSNYLKCIEPDYDGFVDSKMIRRMSRIVKMGVAASMTCLKNAEIENPAAIITATAYGCLEDSSSFLRRMIEFEEKLLSPTAFIQSTHNTVGAQIALLLKCHQYNNTIVHRAFSLENALTESALLLEEGIAPVLVGAVDEITDDRHVILSRFGMYRKPLDSDGNLAGEGSAFFLLDKAPGKKALAVLKGIRTLYNSENQTTIHESISGLLSENKTSMEEVDLILTSHTGNKERDKLDDHLLVSVFSGKTTFPFKSLCGDYPTASGFAMWMAAVILKEQILPFWMEKNIFPIRNILIHHRSDDTHQSLILIGSL